MPTLLEITISTILEEPNNMRDKTPYLYDIPGTNLSWLHNCGAANKSVMKWLHNDYGKMRRMTKEEMEKNEKDVFVLVADTEDKWWNGLIEWGTFFDTYAWFKNEKLMKFWPNFNRFTLAQWELIEATKNVKHFIKVDANLGERMQNFAKEQNLKMYGDFPYIKPRWRRVDYIKRMGEALKPALKNIMRRQPELRQKLDEYLEKDYYYYNKAK